MSTLILGFFNSPTYLISIMNRKTKRKKKQDGEANPATLGMRASLSTKTATFQVSTDMFNVAFDVSAMARRHACRLLFVSTSNAVDGCVDIRACRRDIDESHGAFSVRRDIASVKRQCHKLSTTAFVVESCNAHHCRQKPRRFRRQPYLISQ
jgi:hypothetical protein